MHRTSVSMVWSSLEACICCNFQASTAALLFLIESFGLCTCSLQGHHGWFISQPPSASKFPGICCALCSSGSSLPPRIFPGMGQARIETNLFIYECTLLIPSCCREMWTSLACIFKYFSHNTFVHNNNFIHIYSNNWWSTLPSNKPCKPAHLETGHFCEVRPSVNFWKIDSNVHSQIFTTLLRCMY